MKSILFAAFVFFPVSALASETTIETDETSTVADSPTSIVGINHIGLSVKNLDAMLAFYQNATSFKLVKRESISGNRAADLAFGESGISYETAVLKAPNMLLELTQYASESAGQAYDMPPQGPGMTHTCFQSPAADPGYDKFVAAGARVLSRGDGPVDIGGYGITYAYAYDPEGNMLELEQLDQIFLERIGYDDLSKLKQNPMWVTQVALTTHDLKRLVDYYQKVLQIKPSRFDEYSNNPELDDVIDHDNVDAAGAWFKMDGGNKVIEIWQYNNPKTMPMRDMPYVTRLGYSFSFEVGDIRREYKRLKKLDVHFVNEPVILGEHWVAYAMDPDGNIYSIRQPTSPDSSYALANF